MYFVIGRNGVIYYPTRGLCLLSIDRFSLLRSSFFYLIWQNKTVVVVVVVFHAFGCPGG